VEEVEEEDERLRLRCGQAQRASSKGRNLTFGSSPDEEERGDDMLRSRQRAMLLTTWNCARNKAKSCFTMGTAACAIAR
jgi:hypothetical protein